MHKQIFRSACKLVNKIVQQAKLAFFNTKILACISSKQLFSITNTLLGKSKTSSLPQRFCDFFENKISTIRDNLNSQTMPLPPVTHTVFDGSSLTAFHSESESIVREVLTKTAIKTYELDPLPSSLLAELIDDLLPYFTSVINDSLLTGSFPSVFKSAVVRPLLKKPSLDAENVKNYRPVSNLPFLSKITEKIVLLQLCQHLESNSLLYPLQSAYRSGHSTETAILKIVNDLLAALDVKHISLSSLLDLSADFDTIDLRFQSYLSDRTQVVSVCQWCFLRSCGLKLRCPPGVSAWSYSHCPSHPPISEIVSYYSLSHHSFSDDNQLCKSGNITQLPESIHSTQSCISDVKARMTNNQLQLN